MSELVVFPSIIEALQLEANNGPIQISPSAYSEKINCLRQLVVAYVVKALHDWNVFRTEGERHDVDDLMSRLAILPRHQKLLGRWLNTLCDEDLLVRDGPSFVSVRRLSNPMVEPLVAHATTLWPEAPELVNCIKSCGDHLHAILTGDKNPLEVLFPGGSFNVTEAIYERSLFAQYCNRLLETAMQAVTQQAVSGTTIRVLEVGAGVGGTTKSLLPVLARTNSEYVFTDLSKLFLVRAAQKFGQYTALSRKIFDVEKPPSSQGFEEGSFDVVVAANVLHATQNIRSTMRHVRSLLRPRGVLLLWELVENQTWLDLTFALLEGWSRHADDLRADRPTLSVAQWHDLMITSGFGNNRHFPASESLMQVLGNVVFVAEATV